MELPSSPKYTRSTSAWGATLTPRRTLAKTRGTQTKRKPHTPGWDEGFSFLSKGTGMGPESLGGSWKRGQVPAPQEAPSPVWASAEMDGPGVGHTAGQWQKRDQCRGHGLPLCRPSTAPVQASLQAQHRPHCRPSAIPVQASLQPQHRPQCNPHCSPSAGLTAGLVQAQCSPSAAPAQASLHPQHSPSAGPSTGSL